MSSTPFPLSFNPLATSHSSMLSDSLPHYELWSPYAYAAALVLEDSSAVNRQVIVMSPDPQRPHWWVSHREMQPGQRYRFAILTEKPDEEASLQDLLSQAPAFPDPRSRRQPEGIHGSSEVWFPARSAASSWQGRDLAGSVIYELHIGTFTPEGTFSSASEKLPYLADLGVTTVELLPVQPFGGRHNWGYDGVLWHAVQESYGGPQGLKNFIDEAHRHGIAVILDVVFNHFGPDGNYTGIFAPYTSGGSTGWGEVVNISGKGSDPVRSYILDAIAQWFLDFGVDGLRLDAVHAYDDRGAWSIMEQMQNLTQEITQQTGIPRYLIAESDQNDPRITASPARGGYGLAAQWNDDFHHAIHVAVSGETQGYYEDFSPLYTLATVFSRIFWHDGRFSSFRGRTHGRPLDCESIDPSSFLIYSTTHDQTGNRAGGDRPSMYLSPEQQIVKAVLVLTSRHTPMLFQGEEWGASTPFAFFVDHESEELNRLTAEGRLREFSEAGWNPDDVLRPDDPDTFFSSQLRWDERSTLPHSTIERAYRQLLDLRSEYRLSLAESPDILWHDDSLSGVPLESTVENITPPSLGGAGRWIVLRYPLPHLRPQETVSPPYLSVFLNLSSQDAEIPWDYPLADSPSRTILFQYGQEPQYVNSSGDTHNPTLILGAWSSLILFESLED